MENTEKNETVFMYHQFNELIRPVLPKKPDAPKSVEFLHTSLS
jgi:hypothetical protein